MTSQPDEIMTLADVARFTKTSTATIRSLITSGRLRAIEIGSGGSRRHFRVARRDLMDFLGLGVGPNTPIESDPKQSRLHSVPRNQARL
jgi:excisionase family DNA binding protein